MAGHSKWNNIKNRKAAVDAKKSKVFTQISQLIQSAVRESGIDDPTKNPSLRLAMDKARAANMTNEAVRRAITRGMGKGESGSLEEIIYEAYGPGGVAMIILARTDNKQRTGAEVRFTLDRAGGSLSGPGSAMFVFRREQSEFIPTAPFEVDSSTMHEILSLVSTLEEHEDIDGVWTNVVEKADEKEKE